jgi:hypothetical protein
MSKITRYYGNVDANTTLLTSIDTTPITIDTSFTVDVFYGGRDTSNSSLETTWIYRYILTYTKITNISLVDTQNIVGYANNGPFPVSSSINSPFIELYVDTVGGSAPPSTLDACINIYDCYLNYI